MDKQHSTDLRTHIQSSLNVSPTINPQHEIATRVDFLADYLLHTGLKGYVLGISGGHNSPQKKYAHSRSTRSSGPCASPMEPK